MKAYAPACRVIGVCAAGAPAMAESWRSGRVRETAAARTLADGIAVRVPVPEALAMMQFTVDEMVLVTDEEILQARRWLHEDLGLAVELTGAAGVAAAFNIVKKLAGQLIAAPICGNNSPVEQLRKRFS